MGIGSRRTKIVCTLGPSSSSHDAVRALAEVGMDAARLNFSHGAHEEHGARAQAVRACQHEVGRPLALIADLQGPKLRLCEMAQPIDLETGQRIVLAGEGESGPSRLVVAPPVLPGLLRPGSEVLIDDGLVHLRVDEAGSDSATCTVVVGGVVSSGKGVNVPGLPIPIPSLTDKDRRDLEFALGLGVDYVALSFVRSVDDVRELRDILTGLGSTAQIIAKIERAEALAQLSAIIEAADAVMVARGDLGVEIGPEQVPLVQKEVIRSALEHGRPVITATQMLESMTTRPEPTRAEASDVANAILDGTSAVMLSGETATGRFSAEAVAAMDRIARAVESDVPYRHELAATVEQPYTSVRDAVTNAACDIAETLSAAAILVPTYSGRTASGVARHRPHRPIIAVSHRLNTLQQMALEWGVIPCPIEETTDVEDLWQRSLEAARRTGLVVAGDRVVITAGTAVNLPGSTNLIKVEIA